MRSSTTSSGGTWTLLNLEEHVESMGMPMLLGCSCVIGSSIKVTMSGHIYPVGVSSFQSFGSHLESHLAFAQGVSSRTSSVDHLECHLRFIGSHRSRSNMQCHSFWEFHSAHHREAIWRIIWSHRSRSDISQKCPHLAAGSVIIWEGSSA